MKAVSEVEKLFWEMVGGSEGGSSAWWSHVLERAHVEVVYAAELDTVQFGSAFATGEEVGSG